MTCLIACSTYKKNLALRLFIESLINNNYLENNFLLICDDNEGEAEEVYKDFLPILSHKIDYVTGPRSGIWKNKNRGIEYFLTKTKCDGLVLSDDDIILTQPGLLEQLIAAMDEGKMNHISTYLSDISCSLDPKINSFFDSFPVIMENDSTVWCGGVQGIFLMFKREIIEKVGYFNEMPGIYGGEHSLYSARINKFEGKFPTLFPIFKRSGKYIKTLEIPNNYHDHQQGIDVNMPFYHKQLERIFRGYDLVVSTPGKEGKRK